MSLDNNNNNNNNNKNSNNNGLEDITWPRGDTKFLFEC